MMDTGWGDQWCRGGVVLGLLGFICAGVPSAADANDAAPGLEAASAVTLEGAPAAAESDMPTTNRVAFVRRKHLRISTPEAEMTFLQLASSQRRTREELTVLARLFDEKQMEMRQFDGDLEDEFSIKPDGSYHYSEEDHVLFALTVTPAGESGTSSSNSPAFTRKEHQRLDDVDKRKRFLNLVAAKQLASEGERVLGLLLKEKRIEQAALQEALKDQFSVSAERSYEYDQGSGLLYELVPVPAAERTHPVEQPGGKDVAEGSETAMPAKDADAAPSAAEAARRKIAPSDPGKKMEVKQPPMAPAKAAPPPKQPPEKSVPKADEKPKETEQKGELK